MAEIKTKSAKNDVMDENIKERIYPDEMN